MAAVRIDTQELQEVLRLTPPEQNIMLVGRHGIGKSQILTAHHRAQGRTVAPFFLGQMSDPGDLIGLMHKDEKTGRSVFLPPFWWPADGEPIVLFLDELNRARPEILQSVMDLALNKTLADKRLPAGSIVIAAVNEGDEYQLTDLDPALVSRFNVYEFAPTVEDWLVWAAENGIDPRVIRFIQTSSHFLDSAVLPEAAPMQPGGDLAKSPDRRAWERVSRLISGIETPGDIHLKLIAGVVGTAAAAAFMKGLRAGPRIAAEDVLLRFGKVKAKIGRLPVPELAALNEQLLLWLQAGHHEEESGREKTALENFTAYLRVLQTGRQSEALAHISSLIENPRFGRASTFLLRSGEVPGILAEFIEAIEIE